MKDCLICERVALARDAQYAYLIAEMEHSYFVVGDHQFHEGQELVRRRGVTLTVLPPRFPCAQTGNTGHFCFKTPVPAQSRPTLPRHCPEGIDGLHVFSNPTDEPVRILAVSTERFPDVVAYPEPGVAWVATRHPERPVPEGGDKGIIARFELPKEGE